jgi:hypothetical protein
MPHGDRGRRQQELPGGRQLQGAGPARRARWRRTTWLLLAACLLLLGLLHLAPPSWPRGPAPGASSAQAAAGAPAAPQPAAPGSSAAPAGLAEALAACASPQWAGSRRRVLITGAAGFIGYHAAAALRSQGDAVVSGSPALARLRRRAVPPGAPSSPPAHLRARLEAPPPPPPPPLCRRWAWTA